MELGVKGSGVRVCECDRAPSSGRGLGQPEQQLLNVCGQEEEGGEDEEKEEEGAETSPEEEKQDKEEQEDDDYTKDGVSPQPPEVNHIAICHLY